MQITIGSLKVIYLLNEIREFMNDTVHARAQSEARALHMSNMFPRGTHVDRYFIMYDMHYKFPQFSNYCLIIIN